MKAEVAHISLNPRGGAERLSVAAISALSEMGFDVALSTFEKPDSRMMNEAYGSMLEGRLQKVGTLSLSSRLIHAERKSGYDISVNTHGDMLPLFRQDYSKNNSIVYCHYPLANFLIDSDDKDYHDMLVNVCSSHLSRAIGSHYLEMARKAYGRMILNSTVLTNSDFSRKAIFKAFGVGSSVVHPPVDTHLFQRAALCKKSRLNDVLVISRFHRSKKIENAIHVAKLLKNRSATRRMIIVGNISPDGAEYYNWLRGLVRDYDLDGFVRFEPNAGFSRMLELMSSSKAYLHPLPGEPFGISTVESMSAGLIPVVPDIGGHTEFVPAKYHFHTFGQGADAVVAALDAPASEHAWISHRASTFSVPNFVRKFKEVVTRVIEAGSTPIATEPLVPAHNKVSQDHATYRETA